MLSNILCLYIALLYCYCSSASPTVFIDIDIDFPFSSSVLIHDWTMIYGCSLLHAEVVVGYLGCFYHLFVEV